MKSLLFASLIGWACCAIIAPARAQLTLGTGPTNAAPGCTTPSGASNCRDPATISGDVVNILNYSSFAAAAATGKTILFPANSMTQANNTGYNVVNNDLIFEAGAQLACNGNLQLTLNGTITAPRTAIFKFCLPSFFGQTGRVAIAYPEWWGAIGDYKDSGGSGTGTDNTAAFQNAIKSGIGVIELSSHASYRITDTLNIQLGSSAIIGFGWGQSHLILDDPTGTKDIISTSGNHGNIEIDKIDVRRIQQANGYAGWAYTYAGGTGVVPGDTFSSFGGTSTATAVLKATTTQVTSAAPKIGGSGGTPGTSIVTGTTGTGTKFQANVTISSTGSISVVNYISLGGAYTVNPTNLSSEPVSGAGLTGASLTLSMGSNDLSVITPGTYQKAATGLVAPGSTSGSGSGQKFWITFGGPAAIHLEDVYQTKVEDSSIGSNFDWNGITIDPNLYALASIYIRRNIITQNSNDGIFVYGTPSVYSGDVFIEDQNYIQKSGRAGVELFQNINGAFLDGENGLYANTIGIIADVGTLPVGKINDVKIRGNDVDSNTMYSAWFHGLDSSMYQHNWSNGALIYCTLCTNIHFDETSVENPSGGLYLLGSVSIEENGSIFSGPTNAITFGPYQGVASQWISATGNLYTFANNGIFANFLSGAPATDYVTIGTQLQGNELYTSGQLPVHLKTQ